MAQVHDGLAREWLKQCERGERPPLTVWEIQQLLLRWLATTCDSAPAAPEARKGKSFDAFRDECQAYAAVSADGCDCDRDGDIHQFDCPSLSADAARCPECGQGAFGGYEWHKSGCKHAAKAAP